MSKLTKTQNREVPFELCFKYPLENGYTFKELTNENIKQFQAFLNKVSQMTVTQVDKAYSRKPDTTDSYRSLQVYHYEVTPVLEGLGQNWDVQQIYVQHVKDAMATLAK